MKVPLIDLEALHAPREEAFQEAIARVIERRAFCGGEEVEAFESEFAAYCGVSHAIGVGSGTEALWLALVAANIGPGDEVITVPNTFIATVEAIVWAGATPVFVDVREDSYNLDPEKLEAAISPRTRAIIPVHLYGQPADMPAILEIAQRHDLLVIEDAAQAHGASLKNRMVGSWGHMACFSFYPGKNLGAFGEAGAVVTNDDQLARKLRMFRNHGQQEKHRHQAIGWNGRMDGIQAAVLRIKLETLTEENRVRAQLAARYAQLLVGVPGILASEAVGRVEHVYHLYVVRVRERDLVQQQLAFQEIQTAIHYPTPIHLQPAFAHLKLERGSFPVAEACAADVLSLPMHPHLREEQQDWVVAALQETLAETLAA